MEKQIEIKGQMEIQEVSYYEKYKMLMELFRIHQYDLFGSNFEEYKCPKCGETKFILPYDSFYDSDGRQQSYQCFNCGNSEWALPVRERYSYRTEGDEDNDR